MPSEMREEYKSYEKGFTVIHSELLEAQEAKAAQEEEDHKMALELQKREAQLGKHARDDFHHDPVGDARMDDEHNGEMEDGFQLRQTRCRRSGAASAQTRTTPTTEQSSGVHAPAQQAKPKGTGRVPVCPPRAQDPGMSSATPQTSGVAGDAGPRGPLATVPRGRTPERRPDRARSPRRPPAAGTPSTTRESGSFANPTASQRQEEVCDPLDAAARGDEAPTSEVPSSLSSLHGSREASPEAAPQETAPQATTTTGLPGAGEPDGTEQPNQRGGASTLS